MVKLILFFLFALSGRYRLWDSNLNFSIDQRKVVRVIPLDSVVKRLFLTL